MSDGDSRAVRKPRPFYPQGPQQTPRSHPVRPAPSLQRGTRCGAHQALCPRISKASTRNLSLDEGKLTEKTPSMGALRVGLRTHLLSGLGSGVWGDRWAGALRASALEDPGVGLVREGASAPPFLNSKPCALRDLVFKFLSHPVLRFLAGEWERGDLIPGAAGGHRALP